MVKFSKPLVSPQRHCRIIKVLKVLLFVLASILLLGAFYIQTQLIQNNIYDDDNTLLSLDLKKKEKEEKFLSLMDIGDGDTNKNNINSNNNNNSNYSTIYHPLSEHDCQVKQTDQIFIEGIFQSSWHDIDDITASYKNTRISGGIFLYARQTIFLIHLIDNLLQKKGKSNDGSMKQRNLQICETGFGAGHSAALFLSSFNDVNVITFDTFYRPYQLPIVKKLQKDFPGRLQYITGNSCRTVPSFFEKDDDDNNNNGMNEGQKQNIFQGCDLLHGSSLCQTDNIDLVRYAKRGTILTSTAMHSLSDDAVYFGPNAQWRKLRKDGCISDITCFREHPHVIQKSYHFASSKNEEISHEFCFAVVTGKCHYSNNNSGSGGSRSRNDGDDVTLQVDDYSEKSHLLTSLCPKNTIPPPV